MEQNPPPPAGPPGGQPPQGNQPPASPDPTGPTSQPAPPMAQPSPPPPPMAEPPGMSGSQPPTAYQAAPGGYTTGLAPKNPVISLVVSLVIPGVGTMINGETGKGIAILVGYVIALFLIFALIGFLLAPAVWAFGMYDAYQGAKKWNVAHGFPPS